MSIFSLSDWSDTSIGAVNHYIQQGGKHVVLEANTPKGLPPIDFPPDVLVTDLRYGGTTFIRGKHPRYEGFWTAYGGLATGLARNVTFTQTINDDTPIENSRSEPYEMQRAPVGAMASEVYRHMHNHHQNLHAEVYNFSKDLNGVAIWGDSGALAPGAKSWGGFFSARSWPVKWSGYTPKNCFQYDEKTEFDAAIIGVEVDVLNGGRHWGEIAPNLGQPYAKVGIQIVGFGQRNTAAVEIRTEDSDDHTRGPAERRGAWNWGIIMRNSLHENSTVLFSENGQVRRGIDFEKTTFTDGAMRITGAGRSSGIIFDDGGSGEIYSGSGATNIRIGSNGLKIWNAEGTEILMEINQHGVHIRNHAGFLERLGGR